MGERPPAETSRLSPSAHLSSFRAQLLAVGTDGNSDFGLIQQLYRKEALVYDRAINEVARRIGQTDSQSARAEEIVTKSRAALGLTLYPWVAGFYKSSGTKVRDDDESTFRIYAQDWAIRQLKSCVAAIAALTIGDYHRYLASELLTDMEAVKLKEVQDQIDQFAQRPEAQRLVEKLRRQYEEILWVIESRMSVDPVTARCLSYLMNCVSEGFLTDAATAALVMRGNDSAGSRAVRNPLQVLDVADVASVFNQSPRKITSMVSKIRRAALEHSEIGYFADPCDAAMMWIRVVPSDGIANDDELGGASS